MVLSARNASRREARATNESAHQLTGAVPDVAALEAEGGVGEETAPFACGQPKRSQTRLVIHTEQIVDFTERPGGGARGSSTLPFGASHEAAPPAVWCRVAQRSEERAALGRVERPGTERQGWFQRKPKRVGQPTLVVLECGTLPTTG